VKICEICGSFFLWLRLCRAVFLCVICGKKKALRFSFPSCNFVDTKTFAPVDARHVVHLQICLEFVSVSLDLSVAKMHCATASLVPAYPHPLYEVVDLCPSPRLWRDLRLDKRRSTTS